MRVRLDKLEIFGQRKYQKPEHLGLMKMNPLMNLNQPSEMKQGDFGPEGPFHSRSRGRYITGRGIDDFEEGLLPLRALFLLVSKGWTGLLELIPK